jgi:hypothetical protein
VYIPHNAPRMIVREPSSRAASHLERGEEEMGHAAFCVQKCGTEPCRGNLWLVRLSV